jgi:alcohol dehydrogenase/propanol-preferring alcohol dehydrogenase
MCAGVTTFNALRHSVARGGDLVAVLGTGGLGHLGVQFAARMGFVPVAVARGRDKEALARKLGAQHYVDSTAGDVSAALQALGGARVILSTVTHARAMSDALGGLKPDGQFLVIGASSEPMEVPLAPVIVGRLALQGWASGTSMDSQDTLAFAVESGVRPMVETFPLERADEAYARMMSGAARFRVVLVP